MSKTIIAFYLLFFAMPHSVIYPIGAENEKVCIGSTLSSCETAAGNVNTSTTCGNESPPEIAAKNNSWQQMQQNFKNPPADCRPHTRWWWPFSVTKEEITWELEQMRAHGITGVEQITMQQFYEKGNVPFMSGQFLDLLTHMVKEAKRLGMEVSINFGGPGWIIGGDWVPQEERSKDIVPTSVLLKGPMLFNGTLPDSLIKTQRSWEIYTPRLSGEEKLLAVVAGKVNGGVIDKESLVVLTSRVRDNKLNWRVPSGTWRLMAFWLKRNSGGVAVDHFSRTAMQNYCDYFGGKLYRAFGEEFGATVESMFVDSFELPNSASGIYWSDDLLDEFRRYKGYDLTPYLPAIWWDVGVITPKIRYDVNQFLHYMGLNVFFKTFLDWCHAHGVKGRIQPYGFTTDNIEAAGITDIPEMEITPGEKDQHPWFDTRIGPKKYVASGAHIYGRPVISTEAYTFIHWERYRATLEELKIASDGYLRCGATKFYNHGYSYSPEHDIAPSRTIPYAARISHQNIWWKYYPLLADYIARCSYILRQGTFAPDIAVYSPLANQWTLDVLNARKWTREFDWGDLGKLLVANGYDFDLLNDDALQNIAVIKDGKIKIRNMEYKMLLLPNIEAMPLKSMEFVRQYVRQGGIVLALDRLPAFSTGLQDYAARDKKLQAIVSELFDARATSGVGEKRFGQGRTYFIKKVIHRPIWWDNYASVFDPFLNTLRKHLAPDFAIDFAQQGIRENKGLTFLHRRLPDADIYFVTNIQDRSVNMPVTFRVQDSLPEEWNPYDGHVSPVFVFEITEHGVVLPLKLAPYQSTIFVFRSGKRAAHVTETDLQRIVAVDGEKVVGYAAENGTYQTIVRLNGNSLTRSVVVSDIPAPFLISGRWKLTLENEKFGRVTRTIDRLFSWSKDAETKHFSGTGRYEIEFDLPTEYVRKDFRLLLDPGKVGNIAEVILNGHQVGITWMRGQTLDVSGAVRAGKNHMQVLVTNTLINRVSAMKEPPPVPPELVPFYGNGTADAAARKPREFGFKPLPASGLMGPVKIRVFKKVEMPIN